MDNEKNCLKRWGVCRMNDLPFGFYYLPIKGEGAPIHPEDPNFASQYRERGAFVTQGKRYCDHYKLGVTVEQIENYYDGRFKRK